MKQPELLPPTKDDIAYMIAEINNLNKEIHQYLRLSPLIFGLAASALPLIIAQTWGGKVTDLTLLLVPLVFGLLGTYSLNIAGEAAGLAELRDRLANRVNQSLQQPIYLIRLHGDARRGSPGTIAAYGLGVTIMLLSMGYGLMHAKDAGGWWLPLQIIMTIVSIISVIIGVYDLARTRIKIHNELDKKFGDSSRPESAPSNSDSFIKQILSSLTKRITKQNPK